MRCKFTPSASLILSCHGHVFNLVGDFRNVWAKANAALGPPPALAGARKALISTLGSSSLPPFLPPAPLPLLRFCFSYPNAGRSRSLARAHRFEFLTFSRLLYVLRCSLIELKKENMHCTSKRFRDWKACLALQSLPSRIPPKGCTHAGRHTCPSQGTTERAVGRSAGLFRPKSFGSFGCSPGISVSLSVDLYPSLTSPSSSTS